MKESFELARYRFMEVWEKGCRYQCLLLYILTICVITILAFVMNIAEYADDVEGYEPDRRYCDDPSQNMTCPTMLGRYLSTKHSYWVSWWETWTFMADPGTHADVKTWERNVVAFFVTWAGVLIMASYIGFISNNMIETLGALRQGRTMVKEKGHILLLGWNSSTISLVEGLYLPGPAKAVEP